GRIAPGADGCPGAVPTVDGGRLGGAAVRGAVGDAEGATGRAAAGAAVVLGEMGGRAGADGVAAGGAVPVTGDVLAGADGGAGGACTFGAGAGPAGFTGAAAGRAGLDFAAVFAASAAASASAIARKCFRASSACSRSSELECVFFSVTPIWGRKSIKTLALISSSRASSLMRIWLGSDISLYSLNTLSKVVLDTDFDGAVLFFGSFLLFRAFVYLSGCFLISRCGFFILLRRFLRV